jgi:hypothetical protein
MGRRSRYPQEPRRVRFGGAGVRSRSIAGAESDLPAALGGDVHVVLARLQVGNVALFAGTRCWHMGQLRQIGHVSARGRRVRRIDSQQFGRVRTWREFGRWAPRRPEDVVRASSKVEGLTMSAAAARQDYGRLRLLLERAPNSGRTMYDSIEITHDTNSGKHRRDQRASTEREQETQSSGKVIRATRSVRSRVHTKRRC